MLNLDPAKLLVIFLVALIVLGPDRLPKVARQLAAVWRELSRVRDQVTAQVRDAIPDVELPRIPTPTGAIASLFGGEKPASRAPVADTAPLAPATRTSPLVVVHPGLDDVAFVPDDPSMN